MSIPSEDVVSCLERGGEEYLVRGYGWVRPDKQGLEDIRNISVKTKDGTPIYVKDIAKVEFGSQIKRGPLSKISWVEPFRPWLIGITALLLGVA